MVTGTGFVNLSAAKDTVIICLLFPFLARGGTNIIIIIIIIILTPGGAIPAMKNQLRGMIAHGSHGDA